MMKQVADFVCHVCGKEHLDEPVKTLFGTLEDGSYGKRFLCGCLQCGRVSYVLEKDIRTVYDGEDKHRSINQPLPKANHIDNQGNRCTKRFLDFKGTGTAQQLRETRKKKEEEWRAKEEKQNSTTEEGDSSKEH